MRPRTVVNLTTQAKHKLRPGEALVFDWHRLAICCAAAGEVSLRRTTDAEIHRSGTFVPLGDEATHVYAHRRAYSHLVDCTIEVDCRQRLGLRQFTSDLPGDFGLRASFGRPTTDHVSGGAK